MAEVDLSGVVLDGRYQMIEPLASGAMGSVWRGERLGLGRAVAIKIMHEALPDELASRQRFEREAKLMARLDHPNCVSVIDFGVHDEKPYLVMELVRGTSLLQMIEHEAPFAPPRAVEILRQVLSGLAHAHELGIIHRDIKPANLMVGDKAGMGMLVRILDFGLARADGQSKLTTGIVVGTPNYMAPEQCRGGQLDGRCDLYAAGVVLFEMLTGRKPFVAEDPISVVRMHLQAHAPRLCDVLTGEFGDFEGVVARALAKDPAQRYASAQDMARALDAALSTRKSLGHAVPHAEGAAAPQMATASGWNVPPSFVTTQDATLADAPPIAAVRIAESASAPMPAPDSSPVNPPSLPPLPSPALPPAIGSAPPTARLLARLRPPLTRRQLFVAGGALVPIVIIIAVVAARHRKGAAQPTLTRDAAAIVTADATDAVASTLAEADRLVTSGEREAALDLLARARREHPESAQLAFLTGRIYFAKLYFSEGIHAMRDALHLDPALRNDPELIKTVLRGFITTPDVDRSLEALLREDIGAPAIPYLEETAREHPNSVIRARAASELRRLQ